MAVVSKWPQVHSHVVCETAEVPGQAMAIERPGQEERGAMERNKKERDLMDGGEKWAKFDCDAKSTPGGAATVLHLPFSRLKLGKQRASMATHTIWCHTLAHLTQRDRTP